MNRKLTCAVGLLLFASSHLAEAQQVAKKIPRIGVLSGGSRSTSTNQERLLKEGLRELGWIEGKNIAFEYRYAEGQPDRISEMAVELVQLGVDVVVTGVRQGSKLGKS